MTQLFGNRWHKRKLDYEQAHDDAEEEAAGRPKGPPVTRMLSSELRNSRRVWSLFGSRRQRRRRAQQLLQQSEELKKKQQQQLHPSVLVVGGNNNKSGGQGVYILKAHDPRHTINCECESI